MQRMSSLPKFADGGLIGGLKMALGIGLSPELKAYKERAAAERKAKSEPAPEQPAQTGISAYAGNAPLEKRMKAVDALASGGPVKGPGTGTSDEVPILASNGEFVVRAAAVEEVGLDVLNAINKLGDDNENEESEEAEPGEGGPQKFAVGGLVGSTINQYGTQVPNTPEEQQRLANQTSGYVAGAQAANPKPAAQQTMGALSTAPTLAAPAAPGAGSTYGQQMGKVADFFTGGASKAIKTLVSAPGYGLSAPASDAPANEPAVQMPLRMPAQMPTATAGPVARPTPAAAPAVVPAKNPAPNPASGSPDEVMPEGKVNVRKQANGVLEFSGKDIAGDVNYTGSAASRMAGKGGNVSVVPGMSQALIDKTLTNPDGSRWSAQDNAIMAANIRDGVDPMRGTQRGIAQDEASRLQNLALSPNGTPGKANAMKIMAMRDTAKTQTAQQQIERDKLNQTAEGTTLDNTSKRQMLDAQRAVTAAKTPEERKSAVERLAGLQGRTLEAKDQFDYAPGGQEIDPETRQLMTRPGVIFNKATGQVVTPGAKPAALPPKDKLVIGQTYQTPRGNAVWDGKQFTPV